MCVCGIRWYGEMTCLRGPGSRFLLAGASLAGVVSRRHYWCGVINIPIAVVGGGGKLAAIVRERYKGRCKSEGGSD